MAPYRTDHARRIAESYRILEISDGASDAQLKRAYRDLARIWHPDRCPNDDRLPRRAEQRFAEISAAYRFLIGLQANERNTSAPEPGFQTVPTASRGTREAPPCVRPPALGISTLFPAVVAGTAVVGAILLGASVYDTVATPMRDVQAILSASGRSFSPAPPPILDLWEIGSRTLDKVSGTVGPPAVRVPEPEVLTHDVPRRRWPRKAVAGRTPVSEVVVKPDVSRSQIHGMFGVLFITNGAGLNCTVVLTGSSTALTVVVPVNSSARIGSIGVGAYVVKFRCGHARPVELGYLQFVTVQSTDWYSDRYDITLRPIEGQ